MRIRPIIKAVLTAGAIILPALIGAQQDYPNKPIRIIVPLAAGSVTDVVLRAAAQELQPRLGQPLIIDNRPGASAIVGTDACAKAAPDGYTVCAVYYGSMSINPHTQAKLPYDAERDFAPIARMFQVTEGLVVPASLPVTSVAELRAHAARNPGSINMGTLGDGSSQELFIAWLNNEWKTAIAGIPYKGGGPIGTAVGTGEIQLAKMGVGNFTGMVQGGKARLLAVSGDSRSPLLPQVPTLKEAGLGGFTANVWWGLSAPAATPPAIVARLNTEFVRLLRDPKFVEFLQARYIEPTPSTPQEFAAFMKADRDQSAALLKLAQQTKR